MPDVPGLPAGAGEQRELAARLRAVIEAKDAENAVLRAELAAKVISAWSVLARHRRRQRRPAGEDELGGGRGMASHLTAAERRAEAQLARFGSGDRP